MMKEPSSHGSEVVNWVQEWGGLALIMISAYLTISLLSYDPGDLGFRVYPAPGIILNKGGYFGAVLAGALFVHIGVGSYFLAGLIGFRGVRMFFRQGRPGILTLGSTAVGTVMFASVLLSLQGMIRPAHFGLDGTISSAGGLYGEVGADLLYRFLGWGSFPVVIFALGICLIIATEWTLLPLFRMIRPVAVLVGANVKTWRFRVPALPKLNIFRRDRSEVEDRIGSRPDSPVYPVRDREHEMGESPYEPQLSDRHPLPVESDEPALADATPPDRAEETPPATVTVPRATRTASPKSTGGENRAEVDIDSVTPPIDLLESHDESIHTVSEKDIRARMVLIEQRLADFKVSVNVIDFRVGPVLTTYVLELAPGLKIAKLASYADDLALALKSPSVRIVAPIPGTSYVGVEVPNPYTEIVSLREMVATCREEAENKPLPMYLGKDASGAPIVCSLPEMPNLLIAGTVGSGKSMCLNAIILSMLYAHTPEELKLILIDPKMVELSMFKDLPHLWAPVITDMQKAPRILDWLVNEMEDRYELFSRVGAKKISTYNQLGRKKITERLEEQGIEVDENTPFKLPYIIVIVDELSDMMMVASKEVEISVTRLTQKSRAAGIHLILATQRPSVDVITGLIKSNIPARIAFKVSAKVDSRTILDENGAEQLLGKGDMLVHLPGNFELIRGQCSYVSDKEIQDVVRFLARQAKPVFHEELLGIDADIDFGTGSTDDFFEAAVEIILGSQRGSASLLQRRLEIGYSRASRLIDMMAEMGLVGPYQGSKAREVYMTLEEYQEKHAEGS